jgi:hypothetical protein
MPASKACQCGLSCLGVAALSLYEPSDLSSKERGHRESALGSQNPSLAQGLVVDSQRDVPHG